MSEQEARVELADRLEAWRTYGLPEDYDRLLREAAQLLRADPRIGLTVIAQTGDGALWGRIESIEGDNVKMQVDETWWECVSPSCLYADEPASPTPTEARVDPDPLCSVCSHPRSDHDDGEGYCRGADSDGCLCPGFQPAPPDVPIESTSQEQQDAQAMFGKIETKLARVAKAESEYLSARAALKGEDDE